MGCEMTGWGLIWRMQVIIQTECCKDDSERSKVIGFMRGRGEQLTEDRTNWRVSRVIQPTDNSTWGTGSGNGEK